MRNHNMVNNNIKFQYSVCEEEILCFLKQVDHDFGIPLSKKTRLDTLAFKLAKMADILVLLGSDNKIIGLVAGYIRNAITNIGYISVVAVKREYRGNGYARKLLSEYLKMPIVLNSGLNGIELYTTSDNTIAINLYKSMGFVRYNLENDPRKNDIHLIYYLTEGTTL